ncbi:hypothetical protein V6N13_001022 [Hibiscus sabdariffa]
MSSSTNITNQKVQSGSVASRSRFRFLDEDGAVVRVDKVAKSSKVRSKSIATNASIPTSVRLTSVTGESVLIEGHELKIAKGSHKAVKVVEDESRLVLPSSSKSRGAHGGVGKLKKEKSDWVNNFASHLSSLSRVNQSNDHECDDHGRIVDLNSEDDISSSDS